MQVLCPSCETEYEIPALQRPRKLRCARCASEWRVMPSPDVALAVAGDVPESDYRLLPHGSARTGGAG